jgi:hypothetical protein
LKIPFFKDEKRLKLVKEVVKIESLELEKTGKEIDQLRVSISHYY